MTQFLFFSGKGGVGKTTMACATAVAEADAGRRVLIVTTDPASNLADVFEQPIGHAITAIERVPNLWAMEIDPDKATAEYTDRTLAPIRAIFPPEIVRVMEEQLASPCTAEVAAFDRFADFMDPGTSTSSDPAFDLVIFDTARPGTPSGCSSCPRHGRRASRRRRRAPGRPASDRRRPSPTPRRSTSEPSRPSETARERGSCSCCRLRRRRSPRRSEPAPSSRGWASRPPS